ncbi:hydroxymethylbilane synthase [Berryella wangjianweii]|uniref:Porphobilinogen deaminase n=1 Tax=Berryella wangjianweii TaxID=2734634 RepID=A0A6M8J0K3_9ACTN|nr:hydroxymethylbilane synthase [Berryella wangjianweii]QKF07510.1 hydroxymethylbilane synthase [Berryella wangjianweii]
MSALVIGTRGSALALWQANAVASALREAHEGLRVEVRTVTTTGDRVLDRPLADIGDKGLFTKELEDLLLDGAVDLCVHSMKDLPSQLPAGCALVGMLPRADVRDALVCGPRMQGARSLADVPAGARIGTGSARRAAQLLAVNSQAVPTPMRGNVDTRLRKAAGPDYEGAILAAAGLTRLGLQNRIAALIPVDQMIPAPGQGAVGVEARAGDERVQSLVDAVRDRRTEACVNAERRILAALDGGCQAPLGAFIRFEDADDGAAADAERFLALDAAVLSADGAQCVRARLRRACGGDADAGALALDLAQEAIELLLKGGARQLLRPCADQGGAR